MKNALFYKTIVALLIIVFSFSGCSKLVDYIKHPGEGIDPLCPIKSFAFHNGDPEFGYDSIVINYNVAGNPVSAVRQSTSTGRPNFYFLYDINNRLTDLIGAYDSAYINDSRVETWNKYSYDASGRIVLDSCFNFPDVVNGQPTTGFLGDVFTINYEYDGFERVIKMTTTFTDDEPTQVETYSYNNQGNKTGFTYDNKVNFHQTNKIWMFIDRDYSLNNPTTASYTYNNAGLPTTIAPTNGEMSFFNAPLTGYFYNSASLKYNGH
jgi:hypothetical protein